jgi:hypothetical protein
LGAFIYDESNDEKKRVSEADDDVFRSHKKERDVWLMEKKIQHKS